MEEYRKKLSECYAMESLKTNLRSLKMLDYSLCSILEQNPKKSIFLVHSYFRIGKP